MVLPAFWWQGSWGLRLSLPQKNMIRMYQSLDMCSNELIIYFYHPLWNVAEAGATRSGAAAMPGHAAVIEQPSSTDGT